MSTGVHAGKHMQDFKLGVHKPGVSKPKTSRSREAGKARQQGVVGSAASTGYALWGGCSVAAVTMCRGVRQGHDISRFIYPVPEGQEAPDAYALPEVTETIHETSKNTSQACLVVGKSQAVRQRGGAAGPLLQEQGHGWPLL